MHCIRLIIAALFLISPFAANADLIVIDNRSAAQNTFQCLGPSAGTPCARVFGQSFTVVDKGTYLDRFGFDMMPIIGGPMDVRFRLHEFTGSGFVGPELFSSSVVELTHTQRTFVDFAVGVELIEGRRYMGYLDAMIDFRSQSRSGFYTDLSQSGYSGGAGALLQHSTNEWLFFNRGDFAFRAEFSESKAVPEPVTIDIKPGSDPNSINLRTKGTIPVAVLTTDTFYAPGVNFETVLFGPGGATESQGRSHVKDVDEDGDMDIVLHFKTQETGIQCSDTEATLTGETFDGEAITGTDSVNIVKCP